MRKLRAFAEGGRRGNGKNEHSRHIDNTTKNHKFQEIQRLSGYF